MTTRRTNQFELVLVALIIAATAGCSGTSPAPSAVRNETPPAAQATQAPDPSVVAAFGGEYADSGVSRYVDSVARRVTKGTPSVVVLDSPIVNAFSSGKQIYLTRGMLAMINNEDQLAIVLAREGATIAQSGPQKMDSSAPSAAGGLLGNLILPPSQYLLPSKTNQEFAADNAAIAAVKQAGYNPRAMSRLLEALETWQGLTNEKIDRASDDPDPLAYLGTHTDAIAEYAKALAENDRGNESSATTKVDAYLSHIDGLAYGLAPVNGIADGVKYTQPKWGVRIYFPRAFNLVAYEDRVYAYNTHGALILVDTIEPAPSEALRDYIGDQWAKNVQLRNLHAGNLREMPAASAIAAIGSGVEARELRLFVLKLSSRRLLRIKFAFPATNPHGYRFDFMKMIALIEQVSIPVQPPNQIKIVDTAEGDTIDSIADRSALPRPKSKFFAALNGLDVNDSLTAGRHLKTVHQ